VCGGAWEKLSASRQDRSNYHGLEPLMQSFFNLSSLVMLQPRMNVRQNMKLAIDGFGFGF
jgi:hypothetical protein